MECEICVGEIANPAVCSKRATLLGNVDRANRKAAVRAELTKRLDVKSVGIRGGEIIAIPLPNIGSMGGEYGRAEGATAENAVPFPGAAR